MDTKKCASINVFDGQTFEIFETQNQETGGQIKSYEVDGVELEKTEWEQKQDKAIRNDMNVLGIKRLP